MQFDAPGFGVGEVWLERGRVFHTELPRPRRTRPVSDTGDGSKGRDLAGRLTAFFAGEADEFADVRLRLPDGFYGDCARALRKVRRGEVVSYGELALLAGYPAPRAPPARSAGAARSRRSSPRTASSARRGSAPTATSGSSTSAGCWRSKE